MGRQDRHTHGQKLERCYEWLLTYTDHPLVSAVEVISHENTACPKHLQGVLEVYGREPAGGAAGQAVHGASKLYPVLESLCTCTGGKIPCRRAHAS